MLETLACGIPVVATSVGGILEQVRDGITGFLTPSGDVEAMAARIVQMLEDDGLRQRMQERDLILRRWLRNAFICMRN